MSEPQQRFREYGIGGDYAGARRNRRAFRFLVLTVLGLTLALWFAENYLRYDRSETQYRMALTLPDDSARAILRNVVKRDSEERESPNARYVEALAFIEEDDLVLERYQQAYELSPGDQSLAINYGCRLYLDGQYTEARERFREAGVLPPKNALPRYLEAAALAAGMEDQGDLSEPVAIVARANNSGDPVLFPQPSWHQSLPTTGASYAERLRRIADLCCAPLYSFRNLVLAHARKDIGVGRLRDLDAWLEKLEVMGARLVGNAQAGPEHLAASQAIAGLQIQSDVLELRLDILDQQNKPTKEALTRRVHLQQELKRLREFDNGRAERIDEVRESMLEPLLLAAATLAFFALLYLASAVSNRLTDSTRVAWALAHPRAGKVVLGVAGLSFLALLWALRMASYTSADVRFLRGAWFAVAAITALFGLVHPAIALPSVRRACENKHTETPPATLMSEARANRRKAYTALMRRYYGVLVGIFICVLCVWTISHRVVYSLYPGQLNLLVSGARDAEVQLVRSVQRELASHALDATETSAPAGEFAP